MERTILMQFTIETKKLVAALQTVAVAVEIRSTLPILGNVKIEASGKIVTMAATNLDLYASVKLEAEVEEDGATTVTFRALQQLVGQILSSKTTLTVIGKELDVTGGQTQSTFETLPAEEFPPPLSTGKTEPVKCDAEDFMQPFRMLAHAMGSDESFYNLMGIAILPAKKGCEFAATTDKSRVAVFSSSKKLTSVDAIMPEALISALLKIQPKGEATFGIGEGVISIQAGEVEIISKLIEGTFPNYKQIIPAPPETAFACNRKDLIHAVQTCAIFTDRLTPGITLTGRGKEIIVTRPPKTKESVMGTDLIGQPDISIRLQARNLLDALEVLTGDDVRLECTDGKSPILIREGTFQAILAPLVTQ